MNRGQTLRRLYATVTLPLVAIALGLGVAGWAHAQQGTSYTVQLAVLNGSGATGSGTATINGSNLTVELHSTGLTPSQPHAQHLHIGGTHTCPTIAADTDGDGIINTTEGAPSYGPVMVSLTTSGDVSDKSVLAVDRFPSADASGKLDYTRTFALPAGVTVDSLKDAVVVQHGIDLDKSGKYDGTAKSDLDPTLPQEATVPADCGKQTVSAAAAGSPTTAAGSTQVAGSTPTTARTGVAAPNTGDGTTATGSSSWLTLVLLGGLALAIGGAAVGAYGITRNRA